MHQCIIIIIIIIIIIMKFLVRLLPARLWGDMQTLSS